MSASKSDLFIITGQLGPLGSCRSLDQWIRLGQPTLTVPSPLTGWMAVGRLYIKVGLLGGFSGCSCNIEATMTRPFSSGELRTMMGCFPTALWKTLVVSNTTHQAGRTHTIALEYVWKSLGFANITVPGNIFDVVMFSVWIGLGYLDSYLFTERHSRLV